MNEARSTPRPPPPATQPGPEVGLATSVLLPREERVAFGVIAKNRSCVYGKSALYVGKTPGAKARGPYPAPADSIVQKSSFLSRGAASDTADIKAIYAAQVPLPKPGRYAILAAAERKAVSGLGRAR